MAHQTKCALKILALSLLIAATAAGSDYRIYHHCYQEGGRCGEKIISCGADGDVIDVVWSAIGYSAYWLLVPFHRNCSITDETCYRQLDEPARNCSGLSTCHLHTCSASIWQPISCPHAVNTNFLRINYTCVKNETTTLSPLTTLVSTTQKESVAMTTETPSATTEDTSSDKDSRRLIAIISTCLVSLVIIVTLISVLLVTMTGDNRVTPVTALKKPCPRLEPCPTPANKIKMELLATDDVRSKQ